MVEGLKDVLKSLIINAFNGFDFMVKVTQDMLMEGLSSWTDVMKIAEGFKPFCYTIIAICLLIEIAQVLTKVDILKWEHGLKLGVKMTLAKVCIDTAPTFLQACYEQAVVWVGKASTLTGGSTIGKQLSKDIGTLLDSVKGLGSVLGLFMTVAIVALAITICSLVIRVIAFGRMFELYVYLAVSPLPCAFFPLGDGSGGGFSRITAKFFKNFIAVCLQGVLMMVCLRLFGILIQTVISAEITSTTPSVSDLCYTMLMGAIALVMSVTKCGSWAKSIIDAM